MSRSIASGNRSARSRVDGVGYLTAVLVLAFTFLIVFPLGMLLFGAFRSAAPSMSGNWSLDGIITAYTSSSTYSALGNSLILACATAPIGTGLGFLFAWLSARSITPLRRILTPVMIVVLALPPLFYGLSWSLLGSERVGLLNTVFRWATGGQGAPINIFSWPGLILVMSFKAVAFAYLLLIGPAKGLNRAIEEAALLAGAGRARMVLTIDAPVLLPALAGVLILQFVIALESFELPVFIGLPGGINVFSTEMFHYIHDAVPSNYAAASSLSIALVLLIAGLAWTRSRAMAGRSFSTVTGKGFDRGPWDLGRWKFVWSFVIAAFAFLAVVLPLIGLGIGSLQPIYGLYRDMSLDNYHDVISDPVIVNSFWRTFGVAIGGGFVAMVISTLAAYVVVRFGNRRSSRVLSIITWLPWAVPGLVLSLAFAWAYLSVPGFRSLYGGPTLVLIALVVAAIPLAMRISESAIVQLGVDLEEAARVSGASRTRSVLNVLVPLTIPSFLAGWFLAGLMISGRLDIPILLSSSTNKMLSVVVFDLYNSGRGTVAAAAFMLMILSFLCVLVLGQLVRWALNITRARLARRSAASPRPDPEKAVTSQVTAESSLRTGTDSSRSTASTRG